MTCSRLVAKTTGSVPLRVAAVSLFMFVVSAEAKTSAGAPWVICCTRAEDASKLNVALASGLAAVNASPTALNESVSDAAAKTVMSPETVGVLVAAAAVVAAAVVAAAAVSEAAAEAAAVVVTASLLSLSHAAATSAKRVSGARSRRAVRLMRG
jgi:hypothetical protein